MENSQKTIKILIMAAVLIALVIIGKEIMSSGKNTESESQKSAPEASETLPQDTVESVPSSDATEDQAASEIPAVQESTPAERVNRPSSPSDAASYSEEDLPPELR